MSSPCPLSSPSLDIIPELAHLTGVCPCPLCTCGHHPCPGLPRKPAHLPFHTSYGLAYPSPQILPIAKRRHCIVPDYKPTPWKLETQSSMRRDYPWPGTIDLRKPETRSISPSLKPSVSVSSYHKDFPDWGPAGVPSKHMPSRPLRGGEVRFQGKSSYQQDFDRKEVGEGEKTMDCSIREKRAKSSIRLRDVSDDRLETTNKRMFEEVRRKAGNCRVRAPMEEYVQLVNPVCHHTTTARCSYSLQCSPQRVAFRRKNKNRLLL